MTLLLRHRGLSPLNTLCKSSVCLCFLSASSLLPVLLDSGVLHCVTRLKGSPLHAHFTLKGLHQRRFNSLWSFSMRPNSCSAHSKLYKSVSPLHHILTLYFSALHCHTPFFYRAFYMLTGRKQCRFTAKTHSSWIERKGSAAQF